MYIRLSKHPNKKEVREIIAETIAIVDIILKEHEYKSTIYNIIYKQLLDIQELIIIKQSLFDPDEIFDRYTIGAIAIKNFDEDDEMRERLCDIFYGAVHYDELIE